MTLKASFLCASAIVGLAFGAPAALAADTVGIPGSVAPWVAGASKVGSAPSDRTVSILVHMTLSHKDALARLVDAVSRPKSPDYGKYLTAAAFRSRFAPDPADVTAARDMLEHAGMTHIVTGPGGMYISAKATVAQLASTFGVNQDLYSVRGQTLRANAIEPQIPAALAGKILSIEGLDDSGYLRTPQHVSVVEGQRVAPRLISTTSTITPPPVAANNPSPYCNTYFGPGIKAKLSTAPTPYATSLPWLGCGYTPAQIRAAYGLNLVKLDGTGVRVAIVDAYASPTLQADGNAYAANHRLPRLTAKNFTQIIPEGIYGVSPSDPCGPYGWWGEESLDLAAVHGSAPGAAITYIGAESCAAPLSQALANAVYNQQADIITNSYSYNGDSDSESDIQAQTQVFLAADAMGITVLFSSGDNGDLSQSNGVATGAFESDSPYVTGVGGTTLLLYGPGGAKGEYGWGTYRDLLGGVTVNSSTSVTTSGLETTTDFGATYDAFTFYSGAGGGISLLSPQPAYQAGVVPAVLATSLNTAGGNTITLPNPQRVAPDLAALADPYTGYLYGETMTIAGNPIADHGCKPISATTEYCEDAIGGTSLASPLTAGMFAVLDQARLAAGKPVVGFANPLLYSLKVGTATSLTSGPLNDIVPPPKPTAVLRGYASNLNEARLVTVNSVPFDITVNPFALEVCGLAICEGINDAFNYVTPGYDDVTGLGVPYAPLFSQQ
jgi:subtilase family serine protease